MMIPTAPTKTHVLKNGWTAEVVEYFTQDQFERIQDVLLEGIKYDAGSQQQVGEVTAVQLRKSNEVAVLEAVKSLTAPDGSVFTGADLTNEVIRSMPYDPENPQGELVGIINSLTNPKKKES